jgi:hypothetical protein
LKALLNTAVDLCLLRLGPQHLPASPILLLVCLLLNLLVGVLMVTEVNMGLAEALAESLFEIAFMLVALYLALRIYKKLPRFNQAATALMLSGLLLGLFSLPLVSWNQRSQSVLSGMLLLLLIFWSIVVMGHILRHTFNIPLNVGIAVGVFYTLLSLNLTILLFPVTI